MGMPRQVKARVATLLALAAFACRSLADEAPDAQKILREVRLNQSEQHQALAIWRAVETRRDLIRATNTGLTSAIAATGEVIAELPIFTAAALPVEVRLLHASTVYAKVGDVFAWAVVAVAIALAVVRRGASGNGFSIGGSIAASIGRCC